ncbi:hypothetical protein D3C71_1031350 [compost metagenome]
MGVHRALGLARRARRIKPEARVVRAGGRWCGQRRRTVQGRLQIAGARTQLAHRQRYQQRAHFVRAARHGLGQNRQQGPRNQSSLRPAVRQHVGIVVCGQQGVDRHRHHPCIQAAQKAHGPVAGVVHQQQHTLFAPHPRLSQHAGQPPGAVFQIAIAQAPPVVDVGRALGMRPVQVEQMFGEIESLWQAGHGDVSVLFWAIHRPWQAS